MEQWIEHCLIRSPCLLLINLRIKLWFFQLFQLSGEVLVAEAVIIISKSLHHTIMEGVAVELVKAKGPRLPHKITECFFASKIMSTGWLTIQDQDQTCLIMTTRRPFMNTAFRPLILQITSHTRLSECATASSSARPFQYTTSRLWTRPWPRLLRLPRLQPQPLDITGQQAFLFFQL